MKKFFAYLPLLTVIAIACFISMRHMQMSERLSPIETKFEQIVAEHSATRAPYDGKLDTLVMARNEMLRQEKFLWVGTWSTTDGLGAIYLDARIYPEPMYMSLWDISVNGPRGAFDVLYAITFMVLPIAVYLLFGVVAAQVALYALRFNREWR